MVGLVFVASGQTNLITLSELDSAKNDWPKSVMAITNIFRTLKFGEVAIAKGDVLPVLLISNAMISVVSASITNQIPASATDIVERINDLRRHRLIVGKEQYDNCRVEPYNPAEVKVFHRTGIATVRLVQLPPELQQRFGYDSVAAEQWLKVEGARQDVEQQRRLKAEHARQESKRRQALLQRYANQVLSEPLVVGAIGVLTRNEIIDNVCFGPVEIIQVVGSEKLLVHRRWQWVPSYIAPATEYWGNPFIIQKIPTKGYADGTIFKSDQVFMVTGTTTHGAASTVFLVEPYTGD
jgi:hypothetical protein